jgi:hypothetical protein
VLADSGIDYGVQRAIVVTQFAALDFHRALNGARQQSEEVDSVLSPLVTGFRGSEKPPSPRTGACSNSVKATKMLRQFLNASGHFYWPS